MDLVLIKSSRIEEGRGEGPTSPKFSKGFEPLFVEEDEDYERREFEMNERLCSMMEESLDSEQEDLDEVDLDEESSGSGDEEDDDDEGSETTGSSSEPPQEDAGGLERKKSLSGPNACLSGDDNDRVMSPGSQGQSYGLTKMPSYEFKFAGIPQGSHKDSDVTSKIFLEGFMYE